MNATQIEFVAMRRLLKDIYDSGLTAATARRRWESQPGLVEACDSLVGWVQRVMPEKYRRSGLPENLVEYLAACTAALTSAKGTDNER